MTCTGFTLEKSMSKVGKYCLLNLSNTSLMNKESRLVTFVPAM